MFKIGDKVVTKAFPEYVGTVVSIGHKGLIDTYRVRFTGSEGAGYDVFVESYEHEIELHDSVPCVPYAGRMSHTAVALLAAVHCRNQHVAHDGHDWNNWHDEARYIAGVIIGVFEATIYG